MSLMRRDYRSGLRQMLTGSAKDEDEERERVEELVAAIPQEAAVGYLEAWIARRVLRRRAPAGRPADGARLSAGTPGSRSRCTRGCAST